VQVAMASSTHRTKARFSIAVAAPESSGRQA
jgi:hypothetical protein